jgi:hypothetical protein
MISRFYFCDTELRLMRFHVLTKSITLLTRLVV